MSRDRADLIDTDRLRELAQEVIDNPPDPAPSQWPRWSWEAVGDRWYPQRVYSVGTPYLVAECFEGGGSHGQVAPVFAPYIAAADPATIIVILDEINRLNAEVGSLEAQLFAYRELVAALDMDDGTPADPSSYYREVHARRLAAREAVARTEGAEVSGERHPRPLIEVLAELAEDDDEQRSEGSGEGP